MEMAVLQPFDRDIWLAGGPKLALAGFHYPTRMAVIRLADGGLFIWSSFAIVARQPETSSAAGQ